MLALHFSVRSVEENTQGQPFWWNAFAYSTSSVHLDLKRVYVKKTLTNIRTFQWQLKPESTQNIPLLNPSRNSTTCTTADQNTISDQRKALPGPKLFPMSWTHWPHKESQRTFGWPIAWHFVATTVQSVPTNYPEFRKRTPPIESKSTKLMLTAEAVWSRQLVVTEWHLPWSSTFRCSDSCRGMSVSANSLLKITSNQMVSTWLAPFLLQLQRSLL